MTGQPGGIYDPFVMLLRSPKPRSLLLALCWILPAFVTLLARGHETDLSGVYQGHAPASDAARRVFTLNLASDGTAMLTTQYIGKDNVTMHGRWTQTGRQIILTFDSMGSNGPPRPITFRHRDHELSPLHWDPNEWGRAGPPILHRAHAAQGGL
jgi:NlpE N-terminal domain